MNDCVSVPPIYLSGFSGDSATMSIKKIAIVVESNVVRVPIVAYVIPNLLHCDLIIGTDMLSRITRIDPLKSLKWKSTFGDIHYGPMVAIEHLKNDVNDIVDEENSDKHVARIDTGSFGVKYPFLSRVRPRSDSQKTLSWNVANDLQIGLNIIDDIRQRVFNTKQMLSPGFELRKICFDVSIPNGMSGENSLRKISEDSISSQHRDSFSPSFTKRIVSSIIINPLAIFDHLKLRLQIMFSRIVPTVWNLSFKDVYARVLDESIVNWLNLEQVKFNRFIPDSSIINCLAVVIEPDLDYRICLGFQFLFEDSKFASQTKFIVGKELLVLFELVNMMNRILSQSQAILSIGIFLDLKTILYRLNASSNRFECHFGIKLRRIPQLISDCRIPAFFISDNLNLADTFILFISASKFLHRKPRIFRSTNFLNESHPHVSVYVIKKGMETIFINFLDLFSSIKNMIRWIDRFRGSFPKHRQLSSWHMKSSFKSNNYQSSSLSSLVKNFYHEASNRMCHFCFKVLYVNVHLKSLPGRLNLKSYPSSISRDFYNNRRFCGCIGTFNSSSLHSGFRVYALANAYRFDSITKEEFRNLLVSVFVLENFASALVYKIWYSWFWFQNWLIILLARSARIEFGGSTLWLPISGLVPISRAENCCETA